MNDMVLQIISLIKEPLKLFYLILKEIPRSKKETSLIIEQIYLIGLQSMPLVFITALATGMVMTLQFGTGLSRFGGIPYVPRLVTVSILREMGPVFTSLMLAARVGAGLAAEIGSQVVTQQIDAYWALGSSPIRKIVIPKIAAIFFSIPILCALSNLISIMGVYIVSTQELGLDGNFVISKIILGFSLENFSSGFFKTFFFAGFIGFSGCYYALRVTEGTREVGIATKKSVVTSSVLILIGDFILTKLFLWI